MSRGAARIPHHRIRNADGTVAKDAKSAPIRMDATRIGKMTPISIAKLMKVRGGVLHGANPATVGVWIGKNATRHPPAEVDMD